MKRLMTEDRIDFKEDESGVPEYKRYLDNVESEVMTSVFYRTRTRAQQDLNELLGEDIFDFPKDVEVLVRLLEAATNGDSLVVDFFAGSGTTAEACMALNARGGGSRRFAMIQMPEPIEHPRYQSLADLCRERVRRADQRLAGEGGAAGFRAYRLESSAITRMTSELADGADLRLDVDDVDLADRDDDALLTEVLLSRGFDLVAPVEWTEIAGVPAARVAGGAVLATFTRSLTLEQFEALVAEEPAQLILLEATFGGNDEIKVNALQHLKTTNAHRDTPIELLLL